MEHRYNLFVFVCIFFVVCLVQIVQGNFTWVKTGKLTIFWDDGQLLGEVFGDRSMSSSASTSIFILLSISICICVHILTFDMSWHLTCHDIWYVMTFDISWHFTFTWWQADKLTSWHDDKLTSWHDDKLTWWQADMMTSWHDDKLTRIQDGLWAPKFETMTESLTNLLTRVKSRDASASKKMIREINQTHWTHLTQSKSRTSTIIHSAALRGNSVFENVASHNIESYSPPLF